MNVSKSIYDNDIVNADKFTSEKWSSVEKPLEEIEMKTNKMIMNYGENCESNQSLSDQPTILGEIYYKQIRSRLLNEKIMLFDDVTNENKVTESTIEKNKRIKKEEDRLKKLKATLNKSTVKVKLESISTTLADKINDLEKILKNNVNETTYKDNIRKYNYLEFKILILMKIIENMIENDNTKEKDIDELVLGSKKILFTLKRNKTENNYKKICSIKDVEIGICELLLNDLENKIVKLLEKKNVKLFDVANRNPRLIYETLYDTTLPNDKFKLHESQKKLMHIIKDNFENGFLILYKTLPGLGKTSMILSVCAFARKINTLNTKKRTVVLFCCSDILESVRLQVLRNAFNFKVKFGIATAIVTTNKSKKEYKISNSWNCKSDEERELIAADYVSTALILEENSNEYDYILFFDEPTFLTDSDKNNTSLEYLSKILYHLPKYSILSSATLPNKEDIGTITEDYKNRHEKAVVEEIISNKTLTGCFIKDFNSNIIVPHSFCRNTNELEELVKKIRKNPLLGKFYTLPFLLNFNKFCNELNIGLNFDEIENFEQDNVLENILLLFDNFIKLNKSPEDKLIANEMFNNFININVDDVNEDEFDINKLENDYDRVIFNKMITKHAYKYIGCCLIASEDPLEFARNNFYDIVDKIKIKIGIDNIGKYYKQYKNELDAYNKKLDEIEKKCKSNDKIDEKSQKLKTPSFVFNRSIEINTSKHIASFSKYVLKYERDILKKEIEYEDIDITEYINIDDNLKLLLFMGVGLFSKSLNEKYTSKVLELLSEKKIAYLISDESFCYGANYQIKNVIIPDEFGNSHSINTIMQLMGRTSRMGKSWAGKVYLDKYTSERIKRYFLNTKNEMDETININNSYSKFKREVKNLNQQKSTEEKEKKNIKKIIPLDNCNIQSKSSLTPAKLFSHINNDIETNKNNSNDIRKFRESLLKINSAPNITEMNKENKNDEYKDNKRSQNNMWKKLRNNENDNDNNNNNGKYDDYIRTSNYNNNREDERKEKDNKINNKWKNVMNDEFDFIDELSNENNKEKINKTTETNTTNNINNNEMFDKTRQIINKNENKDKDKKYKSNKKNNNEENPFL